MTVLIGDVVEACSAEEFRSDVQLSHYRSKHNLALAGDYIFTRKASEGRHSSVDLLKKVVDSLQSGAKDNRFCIIATYGHGKSHFALAMANYFGETVDSSGVRSCGIWDTIANDARPAGSSDLQGYHKPSLVLVLRGDELSDLTPSSFGLWRKLWVR